MKSLQVPDWVYDGFGGSETRMRDELARLVMERDLRRAESPGTEITAQFRTRCPHCGENIEPGTKAMMADFLGRSKAFHQWCAQRRQMGEV